MIEALRFVSGVMFWGLVAVILACVWAGVLAHLIDKMIRRKDD